MAKTKKDGGMPEWPRRGVLPRTHEERRQGVLAIARQVFREAFYMKPENARAFAESFKARYEADAPAREAFLALYDAMDLCRAAARDVESLAARLAVGGKQRCRLIKLASATGTLLRTDTVDGLCIGRPARGRIFELLAKALTPGMDWRYVNTTRVQRIEPQQAGVLKFWTETGSIYLWEPLPTTDAPGLQA